MYAYNVILSAITICLLPTVRLVQGIRNILSAASKYPLFKKNLHIMSAIIKCQTTSQFKILSHYIRRHEISSFSSGKKEHILNVLTNVYLININRPNCSLLDLSANLKFVIVIKRKKTYNPQCC